MKLLFISSSPLGDAVLTTGILDHLLGRFPNARITVACGPAAASLFAACPAVEKVIVIDKTKGKRYVLDLWRATVLTRWDLIVDLRNNIVSRLVLARRRMVRSGGARRDIHKIMELAERLNLPVTAPHLWLTDSAIAKAQEWIPDGPVLALGPTANWAGKIWAPERFAELASRLTDPKTGILPGATIAIFAGPGEEKLAQPVFDALEDRRTLAIIGHNDLVAVAAALKRCAFYIGNDSGLMHVAATVGTPTLGLFGPGYPSVYRPWGENGGYVSTPETIDELIAHHDYDRHTTSSLMESLSVKAVEQAARKLWKNRL